MLKEKSKIWRSYLTMLNNVRGWELTYKELNILIEALILNDNDYTSIFSTRLRYKIMEETLVYRSNLAKYIIKYVKAGVVQRIGNIYKMLEPIPDFNSDGFEITVTVNYVNK